MIYWLLYTDNILLYYISFQTADMQNQVHVL